MILRNVALSVSCACHAPLPVAVSVRVAVPELERVLELVGVPEHSVWCASERAVQL